MKQILKQLVEKTALPEDHYLDQDAEILEIFVEELEEIFENLQPLLEQWMAHPTQDDVLVTIRRNFHTLKGSGRMVGAKSSGELAWTVEDTLNRVIAKNVELTPTLQQYVRTVFNVYQFKLFDDFKNTQPHQLDFRPLVVLGEQLQQGLSLEPALEELLTLSETLNHHDAITGMERDAEDHSDTVIDHHTENHTDNMVSIDAPVANDQDTLVAQPESFEFHLPSDLDARTESDPLFSETVAIFIEESEDHLNTIERFIQLPTHTAEQYNQLIRALHTLRGSSSMAQVHDIFEASGQVEQLFKALAKEDTETSSNENRLLDHYIEYIRDYLHALKKNDSSQEKFAEIQQKFDDAWSRYDFQNSSLDHAEHGSSLVSELVNLNIDLLLDTELEFDQRAQSEYPSYFNELSAQAQHLIHHTDNRAAIGIREYTQSLKACYDAVIQNHELLNTNYVYELFAHVHQEFIHLFDTLASGQRVGLSAVALKAMDDLKIYLQQDLEQVDQFADVSAVSNVQSTVGLVSENSHSLDSAHVANQIKADKQLIASAEAKRDFDADVLDIFLEEAEELLGFIDHDLNTWSAEPENIKALNNLMRHLHTLKGGANMLQADHIGLIAHELESIYERIINKQMHVDEDLVKAIRLVQDDVSDRLQIIRDEHIDYPAPHTISFLQFVADPTVANQVVAASKNADAVQNLVNADTHHVETIHKEATHTDTTLHIESDAPVEIEDSAEQITQQAFDEEAEELIAEADGILRQWKDQRSNRSLLLHLQRIAHSLKGGAKMVHLDKVADIAYELETAFEQFAVHNFNSNAYDALLESAFVWLKSAILHKNFQYFDTLKNNLSNIQYVDVSAQLPEKLARTDLLAEQYAVEVVQGDGTEPPSMLGEWGESTQTEQSDEMIRISADLIEKMIDLSGENAINRSRIEMDLSQLGNTLTDMELAIQRLADQLRRMEGELESQIIAKHGDMGSRYAEFDPLEMDQYSSLNQLSKSLAESASDLVDFKSTLVEKIKDTEGILLQQSRIQAEIQEGLMRARLVPFSRLLPRLQRLVRQVSTTLNKPTELLVNNTEGELDRTILEKLVSPLEHMLRNALDHGIESTTERLNQAKPAQGKIELDISRQGTDILVAFKDDGKGIDAEKIKLKAIELGLVKADQALSNEDILQFIFHPGFTTAEKVTQISGRGVGLDVVQSGIKALGGQVSVSSELGKGSTFTIRVPTTVAVSDALMVKVGDQQFAVPLAQIDRIVRISPTALDEFFNSDQNYFEIDHYNYKLRYLAEFVAHQPVPKLNGVAHSLPVLLIKGNMGQTVALLVDQLIGSRSQIVMKPIGEQLSSVGAISGATILGDGQVCLILDGQNIARQIQASTRDDAKVEKRDSTRRKNQRHLVMIVDDSVTVRKVTSRLLERHGYDVVTAKDGLDAIEQLENIKPDLMLLDIEMPRMDGFEVTGLVRHHEVHRDLPIIMITSRTGEKHRDRAFSLGVTNYMGKPFQEANLLENISAALETK